MIAGNAPQLLAPTDSYTQRKIQVQKTGGYSGRLDQPCPWFSWCPYSRESDAGTSHILLYTQYQGFYRTKVSNTYNFSTTVPQSSHKEIA